MKYLKYFEQDSDYQSYMNRGEGEVYLPNISYVVNGNVVYFNPNLTIQGSKITGVFNVENTSMPYVICLAGMGGMGLKLEEITSFKVDGVETEPIIEKSMMGMDAICCRFNNIGRHTFEMGFNVEDPTRIITFTMSTFVELDASQFDTSNVTTMWGMFSDCYSLTSLDLSNWDTSNVTDMQNMFVSCESLTSLDLSNWDTSNVTNMYQMFNYCYKLTSVGDLSNWDTSKVTNMGYMFRGCESLTSLDLSNWDTNKVTNMQSMFSGCKSLTSLDLSNWDTSKVNNMQYMFNESSGLTSLDLTNWDVSSVTGMSHMFYDCQSLTELRMGGNPSKLTYADYMFYGIKTNGTFYYNAAYNYSKILAQLPSTWTAIPCTMVDGVLVPNN